MPIIVDIMSIVSKVSYFSIADHSSNIFSFIYFILTKLVVFVFTRWLRKAQIYLTMSSLQCNAEVVDRETRFPVQHTMFLSQYKFLSMFCVNIKARSWFLGLYDNHAIETRDDLLTVKETRCNFTRPVLTDLLSVLIASVLMATTGPQFCCHLQEASEKKTQRLDSREDT